MMPFFPYFEKPVQEWKNIFPDKNFHVGNALIQIPLEPEKTKIVTPHNLTLCEGKNTYSLEFGDDCY